MVEISEILTALLCKLPLLQEALISRLSKCSMHTLDSRRDSHNKNDNSKSFTLVKVFLTNLEFGGGHLGIPFVQILRIKRLTPVGSINPATDSFCYVA